MADTTFTDGVTLTAADWFNDVNRLHYTIFGDPANLAAVKATLHSAPGAIGDNTPSTGAFTTLSATGAANFDGNVTLGNATTDTLRLTTDLLRASAANVLGVGVTPKTWDATYTGVQFGTLGSVHGATTDASFGVNLYFDDTNNRYEHITTGGAGLLRIIQGTGMQYFYEGTQAADTAFTATERFRINEVGFAKFSNNAMVSSFTSSQYEMNSDTSSQVLLMVNRHATDPSGLQIHYNETTPNGTGNLFLWFTDPTSTKGQWRSNGGIANFSANDVNLSSREVKCDLSCYSTEKLLTYEAMLEDIDWGTWKYKDQTHDDFNHGPTVEGVQAALRKHGLADEERSLIGEFSEGMLGLYTEDLKNIAFASLVASNRRTQERLAAIEARVTGAGL